MSKEMLPFVTGSHAYGKPTTKSDLDIVLLAEEETVRILEAFADETPDSPGSVSTSIRFKGKFGGLNIILTTEVNVYETWKNATEELSERKPVTREEAIKVLNKHRRRAGIKTTEEGDKFK